MAFNDSAEEGMAAAEQDRTALGAMQFGAAAADPNLQAVLKSSTTAKRSQRRGMMLNDAIARYDATMHGLAGDVAARDQARRMGVAQMDTSAGGNAMNSWAQFTPRPSWGLTLATAAIGGASSAAGAYLGRPGK